jgi:hypothetical protein
MSKKMMRLPVLEVHNRVHSEQRTLSVNFFREVFRTII